MDQNKLWNILNEIGISDHITCLLRNLHAGQEATITAGHGKMNWFQIGKTQQWPQDWKRSIFIPIPRKAMPKDVQTTVQLRLFHM